jgi:hypothetical protein
MAHNNEHQAGTPETNEPSAQLLGGVENALDGYAKDADTWKRGHRAFREALDRGDRVDDALREALSVSGEDAESAPGEAEKRFWDSVPTFEAIEDALDGYANDAGPWRLGRWTFEDALAQGQSVEKALAAALDAAGTDPESTPADATLRFWNKLQPDYVKTWLEAPINQVDDGVMLGALIHRPRDKGRGAGTFIGEREGKPLIVKHGDKQSLQYEREVLSSVDHRGIPKVTTYAEDVEIIGGLTRMSMEQLPGRSLDKTLAMTPDWRNVPVDRTRAIRIGMGLVGDLQALSEAGYLYRDLSPSHVIVNETGGRIDVGLVDVESCIKKDKRGNATISQPRGTWETMSPEEYESGNVMNESSNVYSAACLVLQMVEGRSPYHVPGGTAKDADEEFAMSRRTHQVIPDIKTSGRLGDVLRKALNPSPDKRYGSLADFRDALRSAL